ncbi:MAG TPA: DUF1846 domain-containing protein [Candidatus Aminicenantes bacterium]|nr:DUF1846 domain-containing protein [Candidatus Aminicenantes bacterium]
MQPNKGFDNQLYLKEQTAAIMERIKNGGSERLYLEFGGKILYDYHASRVLPGFQPNVKMDLLSRLSDRADAILCIYAGDIERKKVRADFGITYDADTMKTIDDFRERGINIRAVVITRYDEQPTAQAFKHKLEHRGVRVYTHRFTRGYPTDVDLIVSDRGYGANEYIETDKPIVVVTGPGPGSGKLATCLSQLYHEYRRGRKAAYAKFETFPIWNLELKHPVNVAYEAATAELRDVNMIDHFHLEAYGKTTVNYNRDLEAFPLLKRILERITGTECAYLSPTDMGVNRAGFGIIDDGAVREAARQEIIRRYFRYACEYAMGLCDRDTVQRVELLMKNLQLSETDRAVVIPAREAADAARKGGKGHDGIYCGAALQLADGSMVTGKNSTLMHAASSLVLNTAKLLAQIPDAIDLLPAQVIQSLNHFKRDVLKGRQASLDLSETLIALAISAITNPSAGAAIEQLETLDGCEVHMSHMPTPGDAAGLRKLGVNVTSDPEFATKELFVS